MTTYVFTFGQDQKNAGHYVRIQADDYWKARKKMIQLFGSEWAFQYMQEEWDEWVNEARSRGCEGCLETEILL